MSNPETAGEKCRLCRHLPAAKVVMQSLFYPLNFARTLIQLGHDPYPLSRGKERLLFGKDAYFQPNSLKYIRNICRENGLATIYTGIGAHVAHSVLVDLLDAFAKHHLDECYPELGGRLDEHMPKETDSPREMTVHQLIRLKVRQAIRDTFSQCFAVAVAQPFWVIMVRQIAQFIGKDAKYAPFNFLQPLRLIGAEEGPPGLFSGLIPKLVGVVIFIWGSALLSVVTEQAIQYTEKDQNLGDEQVRSYFDSLRAYSGFVINYFVRGFCYPLDVVTAMVAVGGSRLAVSMLPFAPMFTHWSDVYDYLSPFELYRGQKMLFRQERGPVSVGADGRLYASKKHFI